MSNIIYCDKHDFEDQDTELVDMGHHGIEQRVCWTCYNENQERISASKQVIEKLVEALKGTIGDHEAWPDIGDECLTCGEPWPCYDAKAQAALAKAKEFLHEAKEKP